MMKMVGGTIRLPGCDVLNDVISTADGSILVSAEAEGKILVLDGATGEVQRVIGETGHRAGQLRSQMGWRSQRPIVCCRQRTTASKSIVTRMGHICNLSAVAGTNRGQNGARRMGSTGGGRLGRGWRRDLD